MNRIRIVAIAGVAATLVGLWIAVAGPDPVAPGETPDGAVELLAICGLLGGAYLLYDVTRPDADEEPVPWSDAGPIVHGRPEAPPDSPPLAGRHFAETLSTAAETARRHRGILPGIAVVREPLRNAYLEAMATAGVDRATAERVLAEGSWTDDPAAAAVLSPEVPLPPRSLRRRLLDWLYPGRAVRRMARRAVDAVARAGEDQVPPVVGQDAPRSVPVYRPSLASFRRGPGGLRGPDGRRLPADTEPIETGAEVAANGDQPGDGSGATGRNQPPDQPGDGTAAGNGDPRDGEVRSP